MRKAIGVATLALVAGSGLAHASLIVYTSQSAFNAATTSPTTFGFGGVAPAGSYTPFTTYSSNGVAFTPIGATDVDVTSATYYSPTDYPADFIVNGGTATIPAGMLLTLSTPVNAIAFELGSFDGGPILATFSTGDTATLNPSPTLGSVTFWGFISSTPFATISLTDSDSTPAVYLTSVTLASAAPEPSTFLLLGCALAAGALFRRK
jgi:hypothetical protein